MTRLIAPAFLVLALAAPASAEVSRPDLSGFDSVSVAGKFDVEITEGQGYAVVLEGDDIDRVEVRQHGDDLRISQRSGWFGNDRDLDLVVRITAPDLNTLSASRGVEVNATGINAGRFQLDVSMGASVDITGTCTNLDASSSMGGALDADGFVCGAVHASSSMGGAASVFAQNTLDASASMGGTLDVSGRPTQRDTSASMGGEISLR